MKNNTKIFTNPLIEEILQKEELENLLNTNTKLKHYIGFEISGKIHLGSGIVTMGIIKDLHELNADTIIFLADWHSIINNKLGGDKELIKKVAIGFYKEAFIAAAKCVGVDVSKLHFVLGSELYDNNQDTLPLLINVSQNLTLSRVKRGIDIMGRKAEEAVQFSSLIYPPLQVADIFLMERNIIHAGMDQRKAHIMARLVADKIKYKPLKNSEGKIIKPVAIHQKLLPSILPPPKWPVTKEEIELMIKSGDLKMSKSKPEGAIFITDTPDEIKKKIDNAFCPMGDLTYNPVFDWIEMLIYPFDNSLSIKRPEKWGGNITINSFEELKDRFIKKDIHPQDLKTAVGEFIVDLLAPARNHFEKKEIQDTLKLIEAAKVTR